MRYVIPLLLALASVSCSTAPVPATAQLPKPGPVITRIVGRHSTIVVRAGKTGPTYSLLSSAGEQLIGDMTAGQLAMKNPELLGRVRSMQDGVDWAGLDAAN